MLAALTHNRCVYRLVPPSLIKKNECETDGLVMATTTIIAL